MDGVLAVVGLVGPVGIIVAFLTLALLSERLGMITMRRRSYRLLFVSVGLTTSAILVRMLTISLSGDSTSIYIILLALALTIGIVITWRYWGWLLSERGSALPIKNPPAPHHSESLKR